ncbi:hypothetical protein HPB50_007452 [Hyalomma asiaticum]|uniref:Uncharacterized protein n=1 Tax=Hyalomma asiaticum TaxID=266040 RepID=A0ACB7SSJ9_HYAAI|nr:hypothetical protein HPB50_007452 [Hyalomma asiaticum]
MELQTGDEAGLCFLVALSPKQTLAATAVAILSQWRSMRKQVLLETLSGTSASGARTESRNGRLPESLRHTDFCGRPPVGRILGLGRRPLVVSSPATTVRSKVSREGIRHIDVYTKTGLQNQSF